MKTLSRSRLSQILKTAENQRILVVGDLMLDQYLFGRVRRISPEAPVPIVELENETFVPGGAANVARNLGALGGTASLFGCIGADQSANTLIGLLKASRVDCGRVLRRADQTTTLKTRIIAHQQQVVRIDRESNRPPSKRQIINITRRIELALPSAAAVIIADYAKGMIVEPLLGSIKRLCQERGIWLSCDPKPANSIDLSGLSLLTPNRKETFELAGIPEPHRASSPLNDQPLLDAAKKLMESLRPDLLLITLGEQGMLLCQTANEPFHIPTAAQEVYDVSGAGDTVIAAFTLAVAAGASPIEAAIFSNYAAGVVVAKVGTATASPEEIKASFKR